MTYRTKSLEVWCQENDRKELLQEWDEDRNSKMRLSMNLERVEYNTPLPAYWKCKAGHEWSSPVVARTLFGRKCSICDPKMVALPIGTKYGCLTIIGDFSVYEKEVAANKIAEFEKKREDFLQGKRNPNSNVDSVDFYDHWIRDYKTRKHYQCRCKCGLTHFIDEFHFLEKKHRYCTEAITQNYIWQSTDFPKIEECGLRKAQKEKLLDSYARVLKIKVTVLCRSIYTKKGSLLKSRSQLKWCCPFFL